jgi:hypothetical protein
MIVLRESIKGNKGTIMQRIKTIMQRIKTIMKRIRIITDNCESDGYIEKESSVVRTGN